MAARLGGDAVRRWEAQGIAALSPAEGRRALRAAMVDGGAQLAVLKLRWPALLHHHSKHPAPSVLTDLVLAEQRRSTTRDASPASSTFLEELAALPVDGRRAHLEGAVREQLLHVLGLESGHPIDPRQGLTDVGVDSLMAVELSNRLSVLVERTLPSTLTFEHPTLADLDAHLAAVVGDRVALGGAEEKEEAPRHDDLADLTADELADALVRELDDAGY
jgi:aryl carrier-like protein